jgi:hypothetical protein
VLSVQEAAAATMSVVWSTKVEKEFHEVWPYIASVLEDTVCGCKATKYKMVVFQALTVWARQYAYMMVESKNRLLKAKDVFYPFANVQDASAGRSNPRFADGLNPMEMANRVRCWMQLHQQKKKRQENTEVTKHNHQDDDNNNESTTDRRARLSRASYMDVCAERAKEFSEFALSQCTMFSVEVEECESKVVIYMQVLGFVLEERDVTYDTARDEFMKSVMCVTSSGDVPCEEVLVSRLSEWKSIENLNVELVKLELEVHETEQRADRILSDPTGSDDAKKLLTAIREQISLCKKRLEDEHVRVGRWMVKKRRKMLQELGYVHVGARGTFGNGWLMREMSEAECVRDKVVVEKKTSEALKHYESKRAWGMYVDFKSRGAALMIPGEVDLCKDDLYHYEEALRCRRVAVVESTSEASKVGRSEHRHLCSLPMIEERVVDTLTSFNVKMNLVTTPRENCIAWSMRERAGLAKDRYNFGPYMPPLLSEIVVKSECITDEVANDAMTRVMSIVRYAGETNADALRSLVFALRRVASLQKSTEAAMRIADEFVKASSEFWLIERSKSDSCRFLDTLEMDDVLISVLFHVNDARSYAAMSRSCVNLHKREALRLALPKLHTTVMTGGGSEFRGTAHPPVDCGVPLVRSGTLVGFNTSFGFYRPNVDGPEEWVSLGMRRFSEERSSSGLGTVRVVLVYDDVDFEIIQDKREPVIRMGVSSGDKLTGLFFLDGMNTPVKIFKTSHSLNPVPKKTYDDAVRYWKHVLKSNNSTFARRRLEEAMGCVHIVFFELCTTAFF